MKFNWIFRVLACLLIYLYCLGKAKCIKSCNSLSVKLSSAYDAISNNPKNKKIYVLVTIYFIFKALNG